MKKKSLFKTILINIGIFIGFLIVLNFLIISGWEVRRFVNYLKSDVLGRKTEKVDPRALLPNYNNEDWAKEYFNDFNKLRDDNYKSYIGWRKTAFKSKYINIDSSGIRITPQVESVKDSVTEIVFLGGSTMWGTGAPDASTIPAFFANNGNGDYKIENFGESGYRAMQSYIYLMLNYNKGYKTDWVISYDGVNEAVGFLNNNDPISTYPEARMRQKLQAKKDLSKFVTDLTYRNYFIGSIENTITRIKSKQLKAPKLHVILSQERTDLVARSLLDAWLAMFDLAKKNNSNFLAVLQPNAALGEPNIDHLTFDKYESLLIKTYDQLYIRTRELLVEDKKYIGLKEHVLDLTHSFDGEEIYYIDWCHVSPNGNKIIAKKIKERIEQNKIKN